jgi:hypothetical protein
MKGIIFLIISCVIILLAVLFVPKHSMSFGSSLLQTFLWMVIPVAGIYCALEHIDMGVRVILGLVAAAIVGYLFFYLGMYLCRCFESIVTPGRYIGHSIENVICILCTLCGIGLSVFGIINMRGHWLTIVSYAVFIPLYFLLLICSQYQYES